MKQTLEQMLQAEQNRRAEFEQKQAARPPSQRTDLKSAVNKLAYGAAQASYANIAAAVRAVVRDWQAGGLSEPECQHKLPILEIRTSVSVVERD